MGQSTVAVSIATIASDSITASVISITNSCGIALIVVIIMCMAKRERGILTHPQRPRDFRLRLCHRLELDTTRLSLQSFFLVRSCWRLVAATTNITSTATADGTAAAAAVRTAAADAVRTGANTTACTTTATHIARVTSSRSRSGITREGIPNESGVCGDASARLSLAQRVERIGVIGGVVLEMLEITYDLRQ